MKRLLVFRYNKVNLINYCKVNNIDINNDDDIEINIINKIVEFYKLKNNIELYEDYRRKDISDIDKLFNYSKIIKL